jgi:hypothetical protein
MKVYQAEPNPVNMLMAEHAINAMCLWEAFLNQTQNNSEGVFSKTLSEHGYGQCRVMIAQLTYKFSKVVKVFYDEIDDGPSLDWDVAPYFLRHFVDPNTLISKEPSVRGIVDKLKEVSW